MKFASIALSLLSLMATATAAAVPAPVPEADVTFLPDTANATAIDEGLVLPRANCVLRVRWVKNWSEAAWRRYRVKAWAEVGGSQKSKKDMLSMWIIKAISIKQAYAGVNNIQTWTEGGDQMAYVDLSFWEGNEGHKLYLEYHQEVVNDWRAWSKGCDVDSKF